jgi:hypothetical protein
MPRSSFAVALIQAHNAITLTAAAMNKKKSTIGLRSADRCGVVRE